MSDPIDVTPTPPTMSADAFFGAAGWVLLLVALGGFLFGAVQTMRSFRRGATELPESAEVAFGFSAIVAVVPGCVALVAGAVRALSEPSRWITPDQFPLLTWTGILGLLALLSLGLSVVRRSS